MDAREMQRGSLKEAACWEFSALPEVNSQPVKLEYQLMLFAEEGEGLQGET